NEDDHVLARVVAAFLLGGRQELIDDGEDDPLFTLADPLCEIAPRRRLRSFTLLAARDRAAERAAGQESSGELLFQVDTVGDYDHAAILERFMQQQGLAQEHHGEGLARAGGVPDDAALASAAFALPLQAGEQRLNAEHL